MLQIINIDILFYIYRKKIITSGVKVDKKIERNSMYVKYLRSYIP